MAPVSSVSTRGGLVEVLVLIDQRARKLEVVVLAGLVFALASHEEHLKVGAVKADDYAVYGYMIVG